jgi:hypothetical protein
MNLRQVVADYGQRNGLPDLALADRGPTVLPGQDGAHVLLEAADDELLIYALAPAPYVSPEALLGLLQACDLRHVPPQAWPIQVAARGQGADLVLMLLLRLKGQRLSAQGMEEALSWLLRFRQDHARFGTP